MDLAYRDDMLKIIRDLNYNGYYSKMAGAWLLSYLFIFFFEETLEFVRKEKIDDFVLKKGIRKALDSFRLNDEQKMILHSL